MLFRSAILMLSAFCCASALAAVNSPQRVHAFASLPDWSGLWGPGGTVKRNQPTVGPPKFANDEARKKAEAAMTFHPSFTPEWETRYQTAIQKVLHEDGQKACNGFGFPEDMIVPSVFEAIVSPEETTLVFSMGGESRHIHTDGRVFPSSDDLWPTQDGYSIGHWEGQTLVVNTIYANALMIIAPYLSGRNAPSLYLSDMLSDQARFTERLRLISNDEMQDDITLEDPVSLQKPWHFTQTYHRQTDTDRLITENCFGNDRNPLEDGKYVITPAN